MCPPPRKGELNETRWGCLDSTKRCKGLRAGPLRPAVAPPIHFYQPATFEDQPLQCRVPPSW